MILLAVGLFGLVVGSFLNVIIHRIPIKESIVWPGSHCPDCGESIRPRDNIPLLSYLLLTGSCRNCGTRIPARYPLVEGSTGLLFLAVAYEYGLSLQLVSALILVSTLVALSVTDIEQRLLPNAIIAPAAVAGLIISVIISPGQWWIYLASATFISGGLLALALVYPGGMGMGDVKMGGMLGLFLGPYGVLAVFLAALIGALTGGALMLAGKMQRRSALPFGVFMALGGILTLFFGSDFWQIYMDAIGGI
ncbi:A24 family peptidase [soil metagenome]